MNSKAVTLLINSCDAYEDILDTFFELLNKFWPDLKYDIVLSTETLNYQNKYFKIENIHPSEKKCSWTKRMYETLEKIKSEYVLFMLDDFFLYDYVKNNEIEKCVEIFDKDRDIVNFTYWPIMNGTIDSDYPDYFLRKENVKHKVAAIAALWSRKQFMKYIKDIDEDIWEFEINGTIRSNTLYPKDKFYCLSHTNDVIPYNFSKYGLISGKWFKDTVNLFENLGIKFDFEKRGIFNDAFYGLNRSFISSFRIEPYIVPNYSTKKFNPTIRCNEVFPVGKFKFSFELQNAVDLLRVNLTEQRGFAVKNMEIEVVYKKNDNKKVDLSQIFGNYVIINEKLVFNNGAANICIPLEKGKKATCISIKGESICPVSEKELVESYNKQTESKDEKYRELNKLFDLDRDVDYLEIKDVKLNPVLNKNKYTKVSKFLNCYRYEFKINELKEHIETLVLSNKSYYSIKNFRIVNNNGIVCRIIGSPGKYEEEYLCISSSSFDINIPEDTKKIYVDFRLTNPVKKDLLVKSLGIV